MSKKTIGAELKKLRGKRTFYEIAKNAGIRISQVQDNEKGENQKATYDILEKHCKAFDYEICIRPKP